MQPVQPQKFVAYYRVSTQKQGAEGLGIEAQRAAVKAFANGNVIAEFTEVESGGKNDRPEITAALAHAKSNKATLLIAKMDRLSRNSAFINNLLEAGVDFVAADQPHATPLTIRILAAVAQEEREQISKRVKLALAVAKQRGVKLGGAHQSKMDKADNFANALTETIRALKESGFDTPAAIARQLNKMGITTPRGAQWGVGQVVRLLLRLGDKSNDHSV
ncbi:recombinase family protein [Rhizobium sp. Leaf262]|uniref:recombinase family protein n=1 Tax=Rhizobium sp. Leaf262 TaxID=1736312 RepID=UPI000715F563|nr:recombinase family protein [Rhizobium sp. Leaf262]KQO79454.1 resolvase [Rhizobium sp. Leaf262]